MSVGKRSRCAMRPPANAAPPLKPTRTTLRSCEVIAESPTPRTIYTVGPGFRSQALWHDNWKLVVQRGQQGQRDRVGLITFSDDVLEYVPPSAKHLETLLHTVAAAQPRGASDLGGVFHKVQELLRRRGYRALHLTDGVAEWRARGRTAHALAADVTDAVRQYNFLSAAGEVKGEYVVTSINANTELKSAEAFAAIRRRNADRQGAGFRAAGIHCGIKATGRPDLFVLDDQTAEIVEPIVTDRSVTRAPYRLMAGGR